MMLRYTKYRFAVWENNWSFLPH